MTVYLFRSDCGRVKVGFTDDHSPDQRLHQVQAGSPRKLECILHFPGSIELEKALHRYLQQDRVHREWFEPSERLANLIAYVREFSNAEGFFEAMNRPTAWAEYRARYGTSSRRVVQEPLPDPDLSWARALEKASRDFRPEPVKPAPQREPVRTDWLRSWERASLFGSDESLITHCVAECPVGESRVEWFNAGSWELNSGLGETAMCLERYRQQPRESAAVWILACIHDFTNSRAYWEPPHFTQKVPAVGDLSAELEALVDARWHYMATRALPFRMLLPKRCLLTNDEFVELCARHRLAVMAHTRIRFSWAYGTSVSLQIRAEQAA